MLCVPAQSERILESQTGLEDLYRDGLELTQGKTRKRLPKMPKVPLIASNEPNTMWTLDFMYDILYYGKLFRTLNVIDESNRVVLAIEVDLSLPAAHVVRARNNKKLDHDLQRRKTAQFSWQNKP